MRLFGWFRKPPGFFDYRFGKTKIVPNWLKDITDDDARRLLTAKRGETVEITVAGKTYSISSSAHRT